MKKLVSLTLVTAMSLALLGGCSSSSSSASSSTAPSTESAAATTATTATDTVTWKFDSTYSTAIYEDADGIGTAVPEQYFMDKIYEVTDGRYQVKTFLDNTLASNITERINGLKSGAFELASPALGAWSEYTDAFAEFNVPFLFKNLDVAEAFINSDVAQDLMKKAEEDTGVKCLWYGIVGFREISNSKQVIKTPDDMKGLKIRTQSDPIQVASFEALGANVSAITFSELFTALQQKLVDAQENPLNNTFNNKFYEVQKYLTMSNHSFTASMYIMSMDVWNSLSAEDQEAITNLCKEMTAIGFDAIRDSEDLLVSKLEEQGMEVYYPTNEELQQFSDAMKEKVWPQCEEIMGTERWERLLSTVEQIEKDLGY